MRHQTCRKTWDFVAACAKSTENCSIMPIQDPKAPKTNARLLSLKQTFRLQNRNCVKTLHYRKNSHGINFRIQIQNFGFFELISITETEFRNFRIIFVIVWAPKVDLEKCSKKCFFTQKHSKNLFFFDFGLCVHQGTRLQNKATNWKLEFPKKRQNFPQSMRWSFWSNFGSWGVGQNAYFIVFCRVLWAFSEEN